MAYSQSLTPRQRALEHVADCLIETFPTDPKQPAYTEIQLARRGRRAAVVSIHGLSEMMLAEPQEFRDELRFLMSVTFLRPEYRRCLQLWVNGWTQPEIAAAYRVTQQTVSFRIRKALRSCYDSMPLSFRRFSHHTIYRRPQIARESSIIRVCAHCEDHFLLGIGFGRYCSLRCRETARHTREERERKTP